MAGFYSRIGSFQTIGWCSFGVGLLGLIFMITGAVITGIAYTEITPPNYDENYDRYIGASVPRLIGPFLIAFGGILLFGSCGFFAVAFYHANKDYGEGNGNGRYLYSSVVTTSPGGNGKSQA